MYAGLLVVAFSLLFLANTPPGCGCYCSVLKGGHRSQGSDSALSPEGSCVNVSFRHSGMMPKRAIAVLCGK